MDVNGKDYPIYYGTIKNVPNHQPANYCCSRSHCWCYQISVSLQIIRSMKSMCLSLEFHWSIILSWNNLKYSIECKTIFSIIVKSVFEIPSLVFPAALPCALPKASSLLVCANFSTPSCCLFQEWYSYTKSYTSKNWCIEPKSEFNGSWFSGSKAILGLY